MWTNLKLSVRRLVRDPAFSVSAVLVVGLAISAAATLFAAYDAVVLRSLGFSEPDDLVSVWAEHTERGWYQEYVAPANYFDWREQIDAFADLAAYSEDANEQILFEAGEAEVVDAASVTGNMFDVLGVTPALGRSFRMEETWSDADPVVILGHDFWQRRFGADPGVLSRRIELSGVSYEIVGVMPADFRYLTPDRDVWIPYRWDPAVLTATFFRRAHLVRVVARIAEASTLDEASEELRAVAARLAQEYPATNEGLSAGLTPLDDYLLGDRGSMLEALLAAVGILLLAAFVNVAYLVMVRSRRRHREVAVRRALGAGSGALARDAAVEGFLLSTAGGVVGVLGSVLGMRLMTAFAPPGLLGSAELRVDGALALFAFTVVVVAAAMFTLLPLRGSLAVRPGRLAGQGTRAPVSARTARGVYGFVVLQVALSAVLVFSAVSLARSFVALRSVEPGFTAEGVLTFAVPFPDGSDEAGPDRVATAQQIARDLRARDGVTAVGAVRRLPVLGNGWTSLFSIEDTPGESFEIVHREADAGYFDAMRTSIVEGRLFGDTEENAIVVNESFARRAFGAGDAIGRRIAFTESPSESSAWWRITGVVSDERQNGLRVAARPEVFTHYSFDVPSTFRFVVRADGDPGDLVGVAREVLRGIDPGLPMDEIATLDEVVAESLAQDRFVTTVAGAFAFLAALLAIVGVYGVTTLIASGWQREFAVRLAVGARPGSLFGSVLSRGGAIVLTGLGIGAFIAVWTTGFVDAFLFETSPWEPTTIAVAVSVVSVSGLLAALPSAVRAMRTDPARSLQS